MRRSSEPEERAQFTVAELLARYGEAAPATGRRHRRAAEDPAPAAEAAGWPVAEHNPPSTAEPAVRPWEPLPVPDSPGRHRSPHVDPRPDGLFQSHFTRSETPRGEATWGEATQPRPNPPAARTWAPAVTSTSVAPAGVPLTPPPVAGWAPLGATVRSDGPVTDQLPRLDPGLVDPAAWSSRQSVGAPPQQAQPEHAQPLAEGTVTRAVPEQSENLAAEEAPAPESGSPLGEWAVMVSQVGIGVVGGATLWLICEWLWQRIPVLALAVALAVITGLVWVVRRVRRAEDLQTTVAAVLVGLFVTVSPAALLLLGR
ncbi:MAG: hypothetical protein JO115_06840 [Pseudonocardiales bacterium]|nr:hypothetical protein [Pseudonocardiales bacterium]